MHIIAYHWCEKLDIPRVLFIEYEELWMKCCEPNLATLQTEASLAIAQFSLASCSSESFKIFTVTFSLACS